MVKKLKLPSKYFSSVNTDIADDSNDDLVEFFDSDDEGFANIFVQPDGDVTFSFQSYDHGYYGSESFEISPSDVKTGDICIGIISSSSSSSIIFI